MGYEVGMLSVDLADKFKDPSLQCSVCNVFSILGYHHFNTLKACEALAHRSFNYGNECGETLYTSMSRHTYGMYLYLRGEQISKAEPETVKCIAVCNSHKTQFAVALLEIYLNAYRIYTGQKELAIDMDVYNSNRTPNYVIADETVVNVQILYFEGRFDDAIKASIDFKTNMFDFLKTQHWYIFFLLYWTLSLTSKYRNIPLKFSSSSPSPSPSDSSRMELDDDAINDVLKQLDENILIAKKWSDRCEQNSLHKYYILVGEAARLRGDYWNAMEYYQKVTHHHIIALLHQS